MPLPDMRMFCCDSVIGELRLSEPTDLVFSGTNLLLCSGFMLVWFKKDYVLTVSHSNFHSSLIKLFMFRVPVI